MNYPLKWTVLLFSVIGMLYSLSDVRAADVDSEWPTYLHDNGRSGQTAASLKLPLRRRWTHIARQAPSPAWPPPANQDFWNRKDKLPARVIFDRAYHVVSDGRRAFFGTSADDRLVCLNMLTGKIEWDYFAEGPIRLSPSLHNGRVFFGADDGTVYCLAAGDGKLVWKRRVVKEDRRIAGNGRIISAWPVRSSVIVEQNRLRLAAGLFPEQGVFQFVLDAATGKTLGEGKLSFSPQGYLQLLGDQLQVAAGRSPAQRVAQLTRQGKAVESPLGRSPDEYPFAHIGAAKLRFAGGPDRLAAFDIETGEAVWTAKVTGQVHSLAVAGSCLLASTDAGYIYCFEQAAASTDNGPAGLVIDDRNRSPARVESILADEYRAAVDEILSRTSIRKGYCLVLGSDQGLLAREIASRTQLKVIGVERDADKVDDSRRMLSDSGLYGQVSIQHLTDAKLPYASGLFNLVVFDGGLSNVAPSWSADEVSRVVRPFGGTVILGSPNVNAVGRQLLAKWRKGTDALAWHTDSERGQWLTYQRGEMAGAGRWTHIYADPNNTACSNDQLVTKNLNVQWFGRPGPQQMIDRHHRTVPPLSLNGRLFIPGDNRVIAVDAFNGTILWNVEIPNSRRVGAMRDCGSMALASEQLYVAAGDQCLAFDVQSGKQSRQFSASQLADVSSCDWGYVAQIGDSLFGSATRKGASRSGHSVEQISQIYYDGVPIVTSHHLFCLNRLDGARRWVYQSKRGAIINPTITMGGGRVYFVESDNPATLQAKTGRSSLAQLLDSGSRLVALDQQSGEVVWQKQTDFSATEHHLYLMHSGEQLLTVGSRNHREKGQGRATVWYDIRCFSARDGEPLWDASQDNRQASGGSHGEQDHHPAIAGGTLFVEPFAYNLKTGQQLPNFQLSRGGHGCGTISASASSLYFRAGNPASCDLLTGKVTPVSRASRPGCWINMIPAGGLLLIPEASAGCTCNFSLQTSMAFAPVEK